jgi:hypothetical protein
VATAKDATDHRQLPAACAIGTASAEEMAEPMLIPST